MFLLKIVVKMPTLEELAAKGYDNYKAKEAQMKRSYAAARDRMARGYDATPFGPTRKANYKAALDRMIKHYRTDAEKWKTNWTEKMRE
jgi:hypothetical protein